jgi:ribonuclease BN (tRNA processing enzyme)
MQIKILGTRGEIEMSKPQHHNHSGILFDETILCDVGEKKYLDYHPKFILITHLQPDHTFFVAGKKTIEITIPMFAPEKSEKIKNIKIPTKPFIHNEYTITPIPIIHSLKIKSLGYLIQQKGKKIFYTGDIVSIEKIFHHQLQRLDAVITEASFFRKGGVVRTNDRGQRFGHAGVPDLVEFFKRFTHRIIFTHFGTWFIKDIERGREKIKSLGEKNLKLEIAHDGSEYTV